MARDKAKLGRNETCHCGSGKKYKKCCLAADEQRAREAREARLAAPPERDQGDDSTDPYDWGDPYDWDAPDDDGEDWDDAEPSLYATLTLLEVVLGEAPSGLPPQERELLARSAPSKILSLPLDELQRKLAELGVDASREAFLAQAAERTSAWEISEEWLAHREAEDAEKIFAGFAAAALWRAYCPERPSREMLVDGIYEGYALEGEDDAAAVARWLDVWDALRPRFTPGMRTLAQAEVLVQATQTLRRWTRELALLLHEVAGEAPALAERGIRFLRELVEQFVDEDPLELAHARADAAELTVQAGRVEEGERLLRELIAERPDSGLGYARLALSLEQRGERERAIAVLEEARGRDLEDADEWDLDERIAALRGEAGEAPRFEQGP